MRSCLKDFDDFNTHIAKAVANIELNSVSSMIGATADMAASLKAITVMLDGCGPFKGDLKKL